MKDDLGVAAGLKNRAVAYELIAQLARVDEVAVVRDGDLPVRAIDQDRLGVLQPAFASCRVSRVTDRDVAGQRVQRALVERIGHVAHRARYPDQGAVGGRDAGALLTAMLQRVEAEVGEVRRLGMAEDPEDAALVLELVQHDLPTRRRPA